VLPLIGAAADAVRRLRDPGRFFGFLAARGIPHPQVSFELPEAPDGWLMKDAHGCGGWHVRRLSPSPSGGRRGWGPADACMSTTFIERRMTPIPTFPQRGKEQSQACYYQREMPGQPMSATFIGNGRDVRVMGFNEQLTARSGTRHFVFRGVIGPVPVSPEMSDRLTAIAQALTAEFDLRGLCSLDFMRDGDAIGILEVNPRPPASLSLYAPGLMRAHLRACLDASLPPVVTPARPIKGMEIIFAPRPLRLDAAAARRLAAWPGIHDLPEAGQYFNTGDPLCTLSADGDDAEQVHTRLDDGRERLLQSLETLE
jgi:predicted ATP-grasp superfamily ATP-dependent carboligase